MYAITHITHTQYKYSTAVNVNRIKRDHLVQNLLLN